MLESEGDGNSLSHLGPPNGPGRSPRFQHQVNPLSPWGFSPSYLVACRHLPLSPEFARSVLAGPDHALSHDHSHTRNAPKQAMGIRKPIANGIGRHIET